MFRVSETWNVVYKFPYRDRSFVLTFDESQTLQKKQNTKVSNWMLDWTSNCSVEQRAGFHFFPIAMWAEAGVTHGSSDRCRWVHLEGHGGGLASSRRRLSRLVQAAGGGGADYGLAGCSCRLGAAGGVSRCDSGDWRGRGRSLGNTVQSCFSSPS